jgi:hypothetical protein
MITPSERTSRIYFIIRKGSGIWLRQPTQLEPMTAIWSCPRVMLADTFQRLLCCETFKQNQRRATDRRRAVHACRAVHQNPLVIPQTLDQPLCLVPNVCKTHPFRTFAFVLPAVQRRCFLILYPVAEFLTDIEHYIYLRTFLRLDFNASNK